MVNVQKQRQRQADAKAWNCRCCWNDRTLERWRNGASFSARKLCKRSKSNRFHSVGGSGGASSVSVGVNAESEELKQANAKLQRVKKELAEAQKLAAARAQAPVAPAMDVDAGDGGEKDAARLEELREQIDTLEELPDSSGAVGALRLQAKPRPIQMQRVSQQILAADTREELKEKQLEAADQQLIELQTKHQE
ncbi:unnamed protein product, partial [Prorocentrum cordatum]